jgi:hypothetical protein
MKQIVQTIKLLRIKMHQTKPKYTKEVAMKFNEYDYVRVKRILSKKEMNDNCVPGPNNRQPRIGDSGTIVIKSTRKTDGLEGYLVECSGKKGETLWLCSFRNEELELITKGK